MLWNIVEINSHYFEEKLVTLNSFTDSLAAEDLIKNALSLLSTYLFSALSVMSSCLHAIRKIVHLSDS